MLTFQPLIAASSMPSQEFRAPPSSRCNDGPLAPFDDYELAIVGERVACGDVEFPLVELLHALRGTERPLRIEGKLLIDSLVTTRPQTDF
jgi:hypothetical protein